MSRLHVVGLGPGGASTVTSETLELLSSLRPAYLRTARHPAVDELGLSGLSSFDDIYDRSTTLDEVYTAIVDQLVAVAARDDEVLYAVPGSPAVAERTVELLRTAFPGAGHELVIHPAMSFVDLAWVRLGIDPVGVGVRIVDGQRFAVDAAGERGPLLVAQCDSRAVLSEVKLAVDGPSDQPVVLLHHLGLPDEEVRWLDWSELDREIEPDHLTALYIPQLSSSSASAVVALVELMSTLRAQCPWDREQTHQTLIRHLVEETYEVVEALEAVDPEHGRGYEDLEEELGDVLFQVVFHCELATEAGQFDLGDVARTVHDKLHTRHPHVFGDVAVEGSAGVEANWDRIKRAEKGRASAMDGIPGALPALLGALKSHERADRAGMAFPSLESAYAKVVEELDELRADPCVDELGDVLFATVGVAHEIGVDPEAALRAASERFGARFRLVEALATAAGVDVAAADQATLDRWWDAAKRELATGAPSEGVHRGGTTE